MVQIEIPKGDNYGAEWERRKYVPKDGEPELPPQIAQFANKGADEVMQELNRLPFFMTKLDETDGEGGENIELEALKSLAYEGEPDEIATNFKNQGNDCFKAKQYKNALMYYTKGLEVDCGVVDLNKALLLNRAACNLELRNYRRCIEDCKKVLLLDGKNAKACFRSGKAFFAIDKLDEAKQILDYGLSFGDNADLRGLLKNVEKRISEKEALRIKKERESKQKQMEQDVLVNSMKLRHIEVVKSIDPPEIIKEAKIRLEDPTDYQSQLIFPALILYPTIDEFDFIAEISELSTPLEVLELILNRPKEWFDEKHKEFNVKTLVCFMETTSGGLVKIGKKIEINQALMRDSPKVPLFDDALKLYVVPKSEADQWSSQWNKRAALERRHDVSN
ncbi:CNS1 [Candida theae]|uniref:CNS1 n=1 Tax=Candida theae TaxID=1198502 RepID=A0AAD5BII9_9ASCO|nr:CNS1 [Candida theae]KAI5966606.1 CNS1 [Candida theae]